MARIGSRRGNEDLLPIDSLMDILTGTVGIMVIVAVFVVLEVTGMSFTLFKPIGRDPQENMQMERVLLQDGKLRVLSIRQAVVKLVAQVKSGTGFDSIDTIADDHWFKYSLKVEDKVYAISNSVKYRMPQLQMIISERAGADGEDINELTNPKSHFRSILAQMDPEKSWLLFMVDGNSIELFRKVREISHASGFVSGWDPTKKMSFPYTVVLSGPGSGESPVTSRIQSQ